MSDRSLSPPRSMSIDARSAAMSVRGSLGSAGALSSSPAVATVIAGPLPLSTSGNSNVRATATATARSSTGVHRAATSA